MHTYIVQFAYDHGNGWAIINSSSPGYIEGTLKRQSRFKNITVTSYKEIEYYGNETSLLCEGGVTTYAKSPYDIAVKYGYTGSEAEWLESLKGSKGEKGDDGIDGNDATINGYSTLLIEAGTNITLSQVGNKLIINASGGGGGTSNYEDLNNQPRINSNILIGDKNAEDLGLATKQQGEKADSAYQKPNSGIPKTDLASDIQTSLGKADTALQSFTETDPTVPSWAKQPVKPTYTAQEVGALPSDTQLFSGSYNDLTNKPTIPAAQVNSDWNASSGVAQILNKPTIPTVPTNVSAFTNDAGYLTSHQSLTNYVQKSQTAGLLKNDGTVDTNTYLTSHQDISGKADKITIASSMPSGGFLPNVVYNLGTLSGDTTFLMASATDNTIANIWYWTFDTPSTAPTITWPQAITAWNGGSAPTISASKHYEVSVMNGIACIIEA